jgi:2-polyprenyl-3-methyl-5-hydroxy-6-metoxy-1,4-benzoquinol methylase
MEGLMALEDSREYGYQTSAPAHTQAYLFGTVTDALNDIRWSNGPKRVFDLGCGNGANAALLATRGYTVTGVDSSEQGVRIANASHPDLRIETGSAYDDLAGRYGQFPALISLEVVEHVFYPRTYARCVFDLLEPGGTAIISTPYNGYRKNLTMAVTGKLDGHFTALWDFGHIKFWSIRTLTTLLEGAGLRVDRFVRVGRLPILAKSMIAIARRPKGT